MASAVSKRSLRGSQEIRIGFWKGHEDPHGTPAVLLCAFRQALALFDTHPLYAGPRQELVTGGVAAGIPHIEEQAALVLAADVARKVVADTG